MNGHTNCTWKIEHESEICALTLQLQKNERRLKKLITYEQLFYVKFDLLSHVVEEMIEEIER